MVRKLHLRCSRSSLKNTCIEGAHVGFLKDFYVFFHAMMPLADSSPQSLANISKQTLFLKHPSFEESFNQYEVRESAEEIPADVSVLIFFGTWCHDSQREVPRMLKILEAVGLPEAHIKMVTLDFSKTDPGGARRSQWR